MADLGYYALLLALVTAFYAALSSVVGVRARRNELVASAEHSALATTGLLTLATIALLYGFFTNDYGLKYVAENSNSTLTPFYKFAALWGGQAGSLLFWGWLLSIYSAIVVLQNRGRNRELMPYVVSVMMGVEFFFLILMSFITNPFTRLNFTPADGQGLNPLLQNPSMVLHPPNLYLGFVGFTVPYAFAMAALITGKLDDSWIKTTRRWTIASWFFLSVGITLGAQWAYMELGWGGYWAWDPVENASFIPWLTAVAYLHSVVIQERRGMLRAWNAILISLTFFLSIFGTFITRSGIISSIHSFAQSPVFSIFFLAFMGIILAFSTYLIIARWDSLRSKTSFDSVFSREGSFLFNNLLFVCASFTVFWGTIFPMISEAVKGTKISVGPPFFNQVFVPVALGVLFLMGVGPLISWRKTSVQNLRKHFLYPSILGLVGGGVLFALGVRHVYALVSLSLSVFVLATVVFEFTRGAKVRQGGTGGNYLRALYTLVGRNKRRYGGYIIHVGVTLAFIGITGSSAFKAEAQKTLNKGEAISLNGYTLVYENLVSYPTEHKDVVAATLGVYKNGKRIASLKPEKNFFRSQGNRDIPNSTEVGLRSTFKEDLYAVMASFENDGSATFKIFINPLVLWMWIGGMVMVLGTVVVMWPNKRRQVARNVPSRPSDIAYEESGSRRP
jgi:cytochrome c-type biogenesis protein CcmF